MNKKKLVLLSAILLLTGGLVTHFGVIKPISTTPNSTQQETVENRDIQIAFVNEDIGTTYNEQSINIGKTLIASFDSKTDYPVEVVSRAIAERGLEDGVYQVMVILPSQFSASTLALESAKPTQATFQYKIQSEKQLVTRKAEQAVSELKSEFNKDLINIYFSSIIGNLQSAQRYVGDVITNEGASLSAFQNNLITPLGTYSKTFSGLSNSPDSIRTSFSSLSQSLNDSNSDFTSIINVNKTYDGEINTIQGLQAAWQKSIEQRETNLATYDEDFSKLTVAEQLQQLRSIKEVFEGELNNPPVWDSTIQQANELNSEIDNTVATLRRLNTEITHTLESYDQKISEAVEASLNNTKGILGDTSTIEPTLGLFVQTLNSNMLSHVNTQLSSLKLLDDSAIERLSLSDADKQYLKNINSFASWYSNENGHQLPASSISAQQVRMDDVKNHVINTLALGGTLSIPSIEGEIVDLIITAPADYVLTIDGYAVSQISDTHYQVQGLGGSLSSLNLTYHLQAEDANQLDILSPTVVSASLRTSEKANIAVAKEKTETVTSEVPVENPDTPQVMTGGSDAGTTNSGNIGVDSSPTHPATPTTNTVSTTKVVTVYEPEEKEFKRLYSASSTLFPYQSYKGSSEGVATFKDVSSYLEFAGLIKTIYDIDLSVTESGFTPGPNALLNSTDVNKLKQIIVNLLKQTTINSLKEEILVPESEIEIIASKKTKATQIEETIKGLKATTSLLLSELEQTIIETDKVNNTLAAKPELLSTEKVDNTDMVTVTTQMNADLVELMGASRSLMEKTKVNQFVSESIDQSVEQFKNEVTSLESEGTSLANRVDELNSIMVADYKDNESFLQAFANVLVNTKIGNEKNQAVYDYLSNPVDATNVSSVLGGNSQAPVITIQDERSPFLLILIPFVLSLALAYTIEHLSWLPTIGSSERVSWRNSFRPLGIISGIAAMSALIVFTISSMKLDLSLGQGGMLTLLGLVLSLVFAYTNNFLLKRFKHVGFLISASLLLLYIISASQLFDVQYATANQGLAFLSPLSYTEDMLQLFLNHQKGWGIIFGMLLVLTPILGMLNAVQYRELEE